MSLGRCSTGDIFIRDVRRSGRWFPESGCILEHQLFRFAEMILRDSAALCVTWYHFFVAGAIFQRHGLEKSQSLLARGRQPCIQLAIMEGSLAQLLRRRIASMLPISKIEEVSRKCSLFDVIKFKSWGILAELLPLFQACRLQIDRQINKQLQLQLQLPLHYDTTTTTNAKKHATLHYINYTTLITIH